MADNNATTLRAGRPSSSDAAERLEYWWARKTQFGVTARVRFYNKLYRATSRGHDVSTILEGMYERFEKKEDPRRAMFRRVLLGLANGYTFSRQTSDFIPAAERVMLAAGEETGRQDKGFEQAQYVAQASRRMRSAVIGAMLYPSVLIVLLCALLYFIAVSLVPTMVSIAPVESWPAVSRALYHTATYIQNYGLLTLVCIVSLFALSMWSLPRWQGDGPAGALRRKIDHWFPPYTIYREYQGATYLIALGALTQAGVPLDAALTKIRKIAPAWLIWHIDQMYRAMKGAGLAPGRAIDTGLLHEEVVGDLSDYGRSGSFTDALVYVGQDIVEDTIFRLEAASEVIGAVIMAMVAGSILWVYGGIGFVVMEVQRQAWGGF